MSGKLKWMIAEFLNRDPRWCWAELVLWSLNWTDHPWYSIFTSRWKYRAKDSGYCGKCIYVDKRKDTYKQAGKSILKRGRKRELEILAIWHKMKEEAGKPVGLDEAVRAWKDRSRLLKEFLSYALPGNYDPAEFFHPDDL